MKRLSFVMLIALTGTTLIQSCKSGDKSGIQVPKDAAFVMHLNNTSLSSKLNWDEVKASSWFKEAYAEQSDSLIRKLMDNPDYSGMETKADMVMYVKKQGRGGYMAFQGTLKDATAFEAFNQKATKGKATVKKEGDGMIITLENGRAIAYTQGTRFIYIVDVPMNFSAAYSSGNYEQYHFPTDSLVGFAKAGFATSGSNSLNNDDRYADLLKTAGDVHFWFNNEQYINAMGGEMLNMMKVADVIKGAAVAATVNFENGKISLESKSYMNEQMAAIYKKYPPKKIPDEMLNNIPSQNVAAVIAMNYSPEALKEVIKLSGLDGMLNGVIEKANYSLDEFVKANKGDLLIAITDFEVKPREVTIPGADGSEPYKYTTTQPDMKVLFATSVNDKAAFDKLITTLSKEVPSGGTMPEVSYQVNNNWFVASNSSDYVNKFIGGQGAKPAVASKLAGQHFGMYIDIQKFLTGAQSGSGSEQSKAAMDASMKMWQDILMTGGEFKNGAYNAHMEVNLVDKNTNSLKQLNQYIEKMASIYKVKSAPADAELNDVKIDTTVAPAGK